MIPGNRFRAMVRPFARQRMVKSGTYTPGASTSTVTGWVSDTTYPGTIVSNQLVVQGTKTVATVTAYLATQNSGGSGFIGIYKNGTLIPGASTTFPNSGTATLTATIAVAQGDLLDVRANTVYVGRILGGTYLEVF